MVIKTAADLADWSGYRKQTNDSFGGLATGDLVHVSVKEFDFTVGSSTWSGSIVLCGAKGDTSMTALKKEGMQFRTGACRPGKEGKVQVQGLPSSLVKSANKTLAKMTLSVALEASDDVGDEPTGGPAKTKGSADAGRSTDQASQPATADAVRNKKAALVDRIRRALEDTDETKAAVSALVKSVSDAEKRGDMDAALVTLGELERELGKVGAKGSVEANVAAEGEDAADQDEGDENEGDDAVVTDAAREAQRRKAPLYQRIRTALAERPQAREQFATLVRQADQQEKAGQSEALVASYDQLEDLLETSAAQNDEAAANAVDIVQWDQYRAFLRPRLRQLSTSPGQTEPLFVSRKKLDFDLGGTPWPGHIVLAGGKAMALVRRLKGQGTQFVEGTCYVREADGTILADGVGGAMLLAAGKTLKVLRLGFGIDAIPGGAAAGGGKGGGGKGGGLFGAIKRRFGKKPAPPQPQPISRTEIGADQQERASKLLQKMTEADQKRVNALLEKAAPDQKRYLQKALASQHTADELETFMKEITGKDATWMQDNLHVVGNSEGKGIKQQWQCSCGPTTIQAMRAEMDPIYALKLHKENAHLEKADNKDATKLNPSMAQEQKDMLEFGDGKATARNKTGEGLLLEGALGRASVKNYLGMSFEKLGTDGGFDPVLTAIDEALAKGLPVPVRVGSAQEDMGHFALITGGDGGPPRRYSIHDPWDGKTVVVDEDQIKGKKINVAGWPELTDIYKPTVTAV